MSSIPIFSSRFIVLLFIVVVLIWLAFAAASSTNNKNMNGPKGWNLLLQRMNASDTDDGNATSSSSATSAGDKQQQHPQPAVKLKTRQNVLQNHNNPPTRSGFIGFWVWVGAIGFCVLALALACFIGGYYYHRRIAKLHQEEEVLIEMGEKSAEEMEELKRQLLASQQKVEELTKENGKLNEELQQLNARLIAELKQQKLDFEGRIAKLQMEYEEILKGLGHKSTEEEEQQIMQSMHEMKIQLPNEDWFNVLAFVPRRQLGKAAYQVGDRQFARILQLYLHDEVDNKVKLGRMEIVPPRPKVPSDRPMLLGPNPDGYGFAASAVDLPEEPMAKNIVNFDEIILNYFDMSILDFLRRFQENSLLANVQLHISYGDHQLQMLSEIHPLITSIQSITYRDIKLFGCAYSHILFKFSKWHDEDEDEERQLQLKAILEQTRILSIKWESYGTFYNWEDEIYWCCRWLYTSREDGTARALISDYTIEETEVSAFVDRIEEDFLEADHAVSFFIRLILPKKFKEDIYLNNDKTNEKLVGKKVFDQSTWFLLISRHSSKAAKHKIEEEEKEIIEWGHFGGAKRIYLTTGE